jgi:hypothetical protein
MEKQVRYTDDGLTMFLKCKDKRDVMILSTFHKGEAEMKVLRMKEANIPKPVDDHNEKMGGADKCDQMLTAYPTEMKTEIWYEKTFHHLINMSTFNAPETGRKNGCSAVQRGCH